MREENIARVRAFAEWLAAGREEAIHSAAGILSHPVPSWDSWVEAHPEAATLHVLQALLDAAPGDPRAQAITDFVLRHAGSVLAPADAEPVRRLLRAHAWRVQGDAFRNAGDTSAALEAYERSMEAFAVPPVIVEELDAARRAVAAARRELGDSAPADADEQAPAPDRTGVLARLLEETPPAAWPELAQQPELQNVGALEQLRRHALALSHRKPAAALAATGLAVGIAERLLSAPSANVLVQQLAAAAWKQHAWVLRLLARYPESLHAFERAERMVPSFDGADLLRASIGLGLVTVYEETGRFDEAMRRLRECQRVYETYGDRRGLLLSAIAEGALLHRRARHREACEVWLSILPAARELGDVDALATIHNNIAHAAVLIDDFMLADSHLSEAVRLWEELGLRVHVTRGELARGRMMIRRGDVDAGIEHLHRVREEFLRHHLAEEAGLCGLDIVEAHLSRGAQIEAEAFAREIVREFTAAGLNQRAVTALGYLSDAIAARKASQETVQSVRRFLRSLQADPDSEFLASA